MDKLREMEAFVRIVDAGSLTAAAEAMQLSTPSMVRLLAGLEQRVGVRLLNRTTRRMALTPEGRDFHARCQRILAEISDAEALLGQPGEVARGPLRFTAPALFGRMHVLPLATEFARQHPEVRIEALLFDRIVDMVEEGVDLGIRIAHLPDSGLVAHAVGEVRRVWCASPAYLARAGWPQHPRELARHACLRFTVVSPRAEWQYLDEGVRHEVLVSGPIASNQAAPLIDACVDGVGIGMFLSYQVAPLVEAGQLCVLLADYCLPPLPVNVVYPQARLLPARTRLFVECLRQALPARIGASL
ncbi:LysR family transcriptional regulator [Niveibacterium sp. 24ML]|uniref:LysR family transcriptional regulator n=1 Tax=Niveibacterium sp. 24ML TaxID=2985512 RepID=UPI00226FED59|nr:LysR family transcriptional regulator [Niveibacterium sp. 24ML]MCX9155719.1 LysR family transcriptional regulator [Niveibacterium sp. 24ML]